MIKEDGVLIQLAKEMDERLCNNKRYWEARKRILRAMSE